MKKLLAMLLAAAMVLSLAACGSAEPAATEAAPAATEAATTAAPATEAATEAAPAEAEAPAEITEVVYYCSVGAYLITLQEEIDKWNQGEGKDKGVYLNLISNINTYSTDLQALLEAGTHYDLIDVNTSHQDWIEKGWVVDLREIDDPELQDLVASYEPYIQPGINIQADHLHALPLEVVPLKMAVNTDLFEANGLELPKTWADVVECAKVITENGKGAAPDGTDAFGYGATTWGSLWSRLTFKSSMSSTGKGWWDPNNETYNWMQYKVPAEAVKTMFENGWTLGMDDLAIDPIRAEFAAGRVGMFPAPSYDYAVYTSQFPAVCNWTVIDMPTIEEGEAPFKGVYLDRTGCSIDQVAYDEADEVKQAAIVDAFIFLNSDYLNGKIYESGGMIPYKADVIANATPNADLGPQWALFGDITNYTSMNLFPDSLLPLEGEKANVCFQNWCHDPNMAFEDVAQDCADRYNAAYQELKADGDIDLSAYVYDYDSKVKK